MSQDAFVSKSLSRSFPLASEGGWWVAVNSPHIARKLGGTCELIKYSYVTEYSNVKFGGKIQNVIKLLR